jgi:hypothetical protein
VDVLRCAVVVELTCEVRSSVQVTACAQLDAYVLAGQAFVCSDFDVQCAHKLLVV